jgi:hypothetical protein
MKFLSVDQDRGESCPSFETQAGKIGAKRQRRNSLPGKNYFYPEN